MDNQLPEQAKQRVLNAQIGAHANASDTYLLQLRASLHGWIANIDAEMAVRIQKADRRRAAGDPPRV